MHCIGLAAISREIRSFLWLCTVQCAISVFWRSCWDWEVFLEFRVLGVCLEPPRKVFMAYSLPFRRFFMNNSLQLILTWNEENVGVSKQSSRVAGYTFIFFPSGIIWATFRLTCGQFLTYWSHFIVRNKFSMKSQNIYGVQMSKRVLYLTLYMMKEESTLNILPFFEISRRYEIGNEKRLWTLWPEMSEALLSTSRRISRLKRRWYALRIDFDLYQTYFWSQVVVFTVEFL